MGCSAECQDNQGNADYFWAETSSVSLALGQDSTFLCSFHKWQSFGSSQLMESEKSVFIVVIATYYLSKAALTYLGKDTSLGL